MSLTSHVLNSVKCYSFIESKFQNLHQVTLIYACAECSYSLVHYFLSVYLYFNSNFMMKIFIFVLFKLLN